MVKITNSYGTVTLSEDYFANLVGGIATTCYGVSGMVTSGAIDGIKSLFSGGKEMADKGVKVRERAGRLEIELHIKVVFGVNIATIVKSISNKVRYTVEQATGFSVARVNVCVDEMAAE